MKRDWHDFKALCGNIEGARAAFETACESLFRLFYKEQNVQQVKVKRGDGGIDIFVGELGVKPITVIQCKFFLESFGDSQKQQIRNSFKTAIESKEYELDKWILCLPRIFDIDDNAWWCNWKAEKIQELNKDDGFIEFKNGNELIDLMQQYEIYNQTFGLELANQINEIHQHFMEEAEERSSGQSTSAQEKSFQKSLLKISYTKCKDIVLSQLTNKQFFDTNIHAIIDFKGHLQKNELKKEIETNLNINAPLEQINSSLTRLKKKDCISIKGNVITAREISKEQTSIIDGFILLEAWIVKKLEACLERKLEHAKLQQIYINTRNAILEYFKLYAYEILIENYHPTEQDINNAILDVTTKNLPTDISDPFILILGRMLNSPNQEQEDILNRFRKCYIGLQYLGLDPALRSNNNIVFSGKTYVLDTDFTLNLIVPDARQCHLCRKIINILIANGANIIIPKQILTEVGEHAKYAHKSYNYIIKTLGKLDLDIILQKVHNVFVEGFFIKNSRSINMLLHQNSWVNFGSGKSPS